MVLNFLRKNRFVLSTVAAGVVFIAVIIGFHSIDSSLNRKIVEYIESFGWQIEQTPIEISYLTIPRTFDAVFENYNLYQKEAGLDLSSFKGARAVRYSYRVLNHASSADFTVRANVIVVNQKIVAADINSNDLGGFMHAINDVGLLRIP